MWGVLRSIHSSSELIGCIIWTDNMLGLGEHFELECCLIHESQKLASVWQHDLRSFKELNKDNNYLSVSYLSCPDMHTFKEFPGHSLLICKTHQCRCRYCWKIELWCKNWVREDLHTRSCFENLYIVIRLWHTDNSNEETFFCEIF